MESLTINGEKWFLEPLKAVDLAGEFFEQIEAAQKNPSSPQ